MAMYIFLLLLPRLIPVTILPALISSATDANANSDVVGRRLAAQVIGTPTEQDLAGLPTHVAEDLRAFRRRKPQVSQSAAEFGWIFLGSYISAKRFYDFTDQSTYSNIVDTTLLLSQSLICDR